MANHPDIVDIALDAKPDEVCMVPERRRELTTEGGLDVAGQERRLRPTIRKLMDAGIAVSLFIAADARQIKAAARLGVPYIELHTGTFCDSKGAAARRELASLRNGAILAHSLGIKVNAGHGINLDNLSPLLTIPYLDTLNIGHSIVACSVFTGLRQAVMDMRKAMRAYSGGKA
jgi:pyridoxine 5-phosphate synthase